MSLIDTSLVVPPCVTLASLRSVWQQRLATHGPVVAAALFGVAGTGALTTEVVAPRVGQRDAEFRKGGAGGWLAGAAPVLHWVVRYTGRMVGLVCAGVVDGQVTSAPDWEGLSEFLQPAGSSRGGTREAGFPVFTVIAGCFAEVSANLPPRMLVVNWHPESREWTFHTGVEAAVLWQLFLPWSDGECEERAMDWFAETGRQVVLLSRLAVEMGLTQEQTEFYVRRRPALVIEEIDGHTVVFTRRFLAGK